MHNEIDLGEILSEDEINKQCQKILDDLEKFNNLSSAIKLEEHHNLYLRRHAVGTGLAVEPSFIEEMEREKRYSDDLCEIMAGDEVGLTGSDGAKYMDLLNMKMLNIDEFQLNIYKMETLLFLRKYEEKVTLLYGKMKERGWSDEDMDTAIR
ncbi:MAG: hypothetical protein WCO23_01480 [bacterium]